MGYALCRRPPIIAHCFRIVDSWHCCKRIFVFLRRKFVIWHDWWLHFGLPGAPWADSGTLGSITKDTLRSRPGYSQIFNGFWCPWVSFGMLGASTLPFWGTLGRSWDDPGTLGSTRKDTVRSRLGFYRFFVDLGDLKRFLGTFGPKP